MDALTDSVRRISLVQSRRIVVKIGSALLVDGAEGKLRQDWLDSVLDDVVALKKRGHEVILVSSGAIAMGRHILNLGSGALRLEESQAAAAAGQIMLSHAWQDGLQRRGHICAQALLTNQDTQDRRRYINARNTLTTLLKMGAIPLVNENDTISTSEIRFGDNDRLAAWVAQMTSADMLVLLSDIDGLYDADPRNNADARFIDHITEITPEIEAMAGQPNAAAGVGSGGMITKLMAARIAMDGGCHMVITNGEGLNPLSAIENGARHSLFEAQTSPKRARKHWIGHMLAATGQIHVDAGAARALTQGKSLLAAGIAGLGQARFLKGDPVDVLGPRGEVIGRGFVNYPSEALLRIQGRNSAEIPDILGYEGSKSVIHVDNFALLAPGQTTG